MNPNSVIVVTSIYPENQSLSRLAEVGKEHGCRVIVIGDAKGPEEFQLAGGRYYGLRAQLQTEFRYARQCPVNHYARKNIGFLLAMANNAELILDQDDDAFVYDHFWTKRQRAQTVAIVEEQGWLNSYQYFTKRLVWPRGFPLEKIGQRGPLMAALRKATLDCPIQSGLVDQDPDVDAIYRMTSFLPVKFTKGVCLALGKGTWCPFNSQNTVWWYDAFPLLYLPATCSFRMTDIWRSFVAQRIGWENDWTLLFHSPNVYQERNQHDLMADFREETPGYLHNREICEALTALSLKKGRKNLFENLEICYNLLVNRGWLDREELELLNLWRVDFEELIR